MTFATAFRLIILPIVFVLSFIVVLAMSFGGTFLFSVLLTMASIYIGIPALMICLGVLGYQYSKTGTIPQAALRATLIIFLIFFVLWNSEFLGSEITGYDVKEAQAYPSLIHSQLEKYKEKYGTYPNSLSDIQSLPPRPKFLRSEYNYQRKGEFYYFAFVDPRGLMTIWNYSSKNKTWLLNR